MKFTAQNAKQVLAHLFTGFKTTFNKSFTETETTWQRIATEVPSQSKAENYAWLGKFPKLREWIGEKSLNVWKVMDTPLLTEVLNPQWLFINMKFKMVTF